MNIFISHKQEDQVKAMMVADAFRKIGVEYYLDVLDNFVINSGEELTSHIREALNKCTDLLVVMSPATRFSQWVPFEIGMASQAYMPIANYMSEDVQLPEFLEFWPRLKTPDDIVKYVKIKRSTFIETDYERRGPVLESWNISGRQRDLGRFYAKLKQELL